MKQLRADNATLKQKNADMKNLIIRQQNKIIDQQHHIDDFVQYSIKLHEHVAVIQQVRSARHTLGSNVVEHGTMRCRWEDILGVHPTDVDPSIRPYQLYDLTFSTYLWDAPMGPYKDFYKRLFDFTRAEWYENGPHAMPLLDGPGFFVRGFNDNPPQPGWKDNGLAEVVAFYRDNPFFPHYIDQNNNLRQTLWRWWGHVQNVTKWIRQTVEMVQNVQVDGFK